MLTSKQNKFIEGIIEGSCQSNAYRLATLSAFLLKTGFMQFSRKFTYDCCLDMKSA